MLAVEVLYGPPPGFAICVGILLVGVSTALQFVGFDAVVESHRRRFQRGTSRRTVAIVDRLALGLVAGLGIMFIAVGLVGIGG